MSELNARGAQIGVVGDQAHVEGGIHRYHAPVVNVSQPAAAAFPDGILWVPLETAPTPDMAAAWVTAALGLESAPDPLSALAGLLYARSPLLILDNAEAAPHTADALLACRGRATC